MFWLCFQAVSACSHILTQVPQWVWLCFSAWSLHAILKAWSNIVDRLWNNLTISIPAHQPVIFVKPSGYFCPHSLLPFHIRWVATLMFLELCDFFSVFSLLKKRTCDPISLALLSVQKSQEVCQQSLQADLPSLLLHLFSLILHTFKNTYKYFIIHLVYGHNCQHAHTPSLVSHCRDSSAS